MYQKNTTIYHMGLREDLNVTVKCLTVRWVCLWLLLNIMFCSNVGGSGLFRWGSGKDSTWQCRRRGFNAWGEKIPAGGNGNPLLYFSWRNSTDRGDCWPTVHEVTKSQTQLSNWAHTHTHNENFIVSGKEGSDSAEIIYLQGSLSHSHFRISRSLFLRLVELAFTQQRKWGWCQEGKDRGVEGDFRS